jgi:uncharacterized protein
MKIAGRKNEIKILLDTVQKTNSEFLAIYGRRRIGKTYLIREVYQEQIIFECSGLHQKDFSQQLENFWLTLIEVNPKEKPSLPKTWLQAFSLLKSYIKSLGNTQKKVIFLDEIAWFETPKSGFLAALDNFWNQFCSKREDIVLVICGSSASWIINKIINDRGGLHNRITRRIQLMPFTLKETKEFLEMTHVRLVNKDIVQLYMSVGGIPFYLKDIESGQSIAQILDSLFFNPQATLKNEFSNLYASLFKNSEIHVSIIEALAKKNKGLTRKEVIEATGIKSGGGLTNSLQELIECGFIKIILPINKSKEDCLYRLVDEYSIFYFKFLQNSKTNSSWLQFSNKPVYKIWTGYAFENLCFKHIYQIKKGLGINGIISNEYSWIQKGTKEEKGTQIDFIIDRDDNCINLLELKFYDSVFEITKNYSEQLREKVSIFRDKNRLKKNIFVTLVTANGAKRNEHYLSVVTNEITIDTLFES